MRRKKRYVEYDYETAYQDSLSKIELSNAERVGSRVYATKEIRYGDQMDIEIYPQYVKQEGNKIPEAAREKKKRVQKKLNDKNSRKMCERIIVENFDDDDVWATLTYTDETMPDTEQAAKRNMQNYIRRINQLRKKKGLKNARYVYVTECSSKGRWHHHIVMDGDLSLDEVERTWTKGRRNQVRRLQKDKDGLIGAARYITKDKGKKDKYQKLWSASAGLRKPKERINHYKTRSTDIRRIVTGEVKVCDHLQKWYGEKYEVAEAEIRQNPINGGFYIAARMRRKQIRKKEEKEVDRNVRTVW